MSDPDGASARHALLRDRQERLARAAELAERGESGLARREIGGILAEDPQYAPALALLAQLGQAAAHRGGQGSGAGGQTPAQTRPSATLPGTKVSTGSWAQFHRRMQLRRETTCVAAMRAAMRSGDYRTALDRARELVAIDPGWKEVELLLEQVRPRPVMTPREAAVRGDAPMRRRTRAWSALAAALVIVVVAAAIGWVSVRFLPAMLLSHWADLMHWQDRLAGSSPAAPSSPAPPLPPAGAPEMPFAGIVPPPGGNLVDVPSDSATSPPANDDATQSSPRSAASAEPGGRQADDGAPPGVAALGTAAPAEQPPALPQSRPAAGQGSGGPVTQQATPSHSPSRPPDQGTFGARQAVGSLTEGVDQTTAPAATATPPGSLQAQPPLQPQPVPGLPAPELSTARPPATGSTDASPAGTPEGTTGAGVPAEPRAAGADAEEGDREEIAKTIGAYAQGYTSLDAASVRRVWPTVNVDALRNAFAQLEYQRVAFTGCMVAIRDLHASATCRGTTTYVPRVGAQGRMTASRVWTFALRKLVNTWVIDSASIK